MSELKQEKRRVTTKDVLWYIPNQIGYARIITAILSFMTMQNHPLATAFLYTTSCLLDALDGTMARKYDQCSGLGAVLDMVTDRSTTSGMMCYLCMAYPEYAVIFQVLLAIDISSHYMHMYASLTEGATSHKQVSAESSKLLHLYYTNRKVLFIVCFFNEAFYAGLYMMTFANHFTFGKWTSIVSIPFYLFKQFANLLQLQRAALMLADIDAKAANAKKEEK